MALEIEGSTPSAHPTLTYPSSGGRTFFGRSSSLKFAGLFALILAAFSVGTVACGGGDDTTDAENSVRSFLDSINNHDAGLAYDNFSKDCIGP